MIFEDGNNIQHIPENWFEWDTNSPNNKGKAWFPYIKSEFPKSKISFKSNQIEKMIKNCTAPNSKDGQWFMAKVIAGPFSKYIMLHKSILF